MQQKQHRKEQFKKTAEATGDLIGNKIADKITIVSKELQNNETEADVETATPKKDICVQKKDNKLMMN